METEAAAAGGNILENTKYYRMLAGGCDCIRETLETRIDAITFQTFINRNRFGSKVKVVTVGNRKRHLFRT